MEKEKSRGPIREEQEGEKDKGKERTEKEGKKRKKLRIEKCYSVNIRREMQDERKSEK